MPRFVFRRENEKSRMIEVIAKNRTGFVLLKILLSQAVYFRSSLIFVVEIPSVRGR